jgi:serine/threonine protein kinase/tetratricopeptide (TPR) repeat protein
MCVEEEKTRNGQPQDSRVFGKLSPEIARSTTPCVHSGINHLQIPSPGRESGGENERFWHSLWALQSDREDRRRRHGREVYRALDIRLEREVALKLISDSFLVSDPLGSPSPAATTSSRVRLSRERFLREARAAATLNHPSICAIYDVGEQDGQPYLVMELLRGETLKLYLSRHSLSPAEVLTLGQEAASALAAAHSRGIIHRDIKPANLFVVESGRDRKQLKILDFGVAKKQGAEASPDPSYFDPQNNTATSMAAGLNDLTSPGFIVGTAAYMSPEQAKGDPIDARTDLFSLGSVLYEMATGQPPFGDRSTAGVFAALLMKDPPPVTSLNPAMPSALDSIIAKLLAKDRDQRCHSAEELLAELEAVSASVSSSPVGAGPAAASSTPPASVSPPLPQAGGRPLRSSMLVIGALLLVALAAGFFVFRNHSSTKPAPSATAPPAPNQAAKPAALKDSAILADFINKTGDPVFDTTLNQALRVQLGQSPVLDIISQQHLRRSLQFLGRKQDETITPQIAREIGEREGVKAILTGTIAPVGKAYVITLNAQNTASGDDIANEEATAPDKEHVLDALNQVATGMRAKLGESLSSIQRLNAPYGQATTPSLEAFRAYALGDEAHQKGNDIPEAEDHYKRALELDPKLAMAWARLGVVRLNAGAISEAADNFTRAYQLSDNVSEREKLYIAGHYYSTVVGDLNKAIETLQVATHEYPLQVDNFINLGALYSSDGELEKSAAANQRALALQPDTAHALENVIADAGILSDVTEGEKYIAAAQRLGLNGTSLFATELQYYASRRDWNNVQRIIAETAGRPDQFVITATWGALLPQLGQFQLARTTLLRAADQAASAKGKDAQAGALFSAASAGWMIDRCVDPERTVKEALQLDKGKVTLITAATTTAVCNEAKPAAQMLSALEKRYPGDTLVQELFVPQSRAWLALKAGDAQQALAFLERVRAHDEACYAAYLRGLAYLQLRDSHSAIASFQTASRQKGVAYNFGRPYALSYLGLGRAYAMAGDKPEAKKAYDVFFSEWKNADADLPVIAEAKKEYAQL